MNIKFLLAILFALLFSFSFAGCGKDVVGDAPVSTPAPDIDTQPAEKETEPETAAPTEEAADAPSFDFADALEKTYVCGKQLAYPLTFGQLGEGFEVQSDGSFTKEGSGKISCTVSYHGVDLGIIVFAGCESVSEINDDTPITMIHIQNNDLDAFEMPKISINGVELGCTHEELYAVLGDSYTFGIDENEVQYIDENGNKMLFGFRNDEDHMISVIIHDRSSVQ